MFHKALCSSGKLGKGLLLPVSVAMKRHEADYSAVLQPYSRQARERVQVTWIDEGECTFDFKIAKVDAVVMPARELRNARPK